MDWSPIPFIRVDVNSSPASMYTGWAFEYLSCPFSMLTACPLCVNGMPDGYTNFTIKKQRSIILAPQKNSPVSLLLLTEELLQ